MIKGQKIYLPFKGIIDIFGSIVGIILCSILLWWWIIIINSIVTKGHPFFIQKRIGKNGNPFNIIKFRSMKIETNSYMTSEYVDLNETVSGFGKFLRTTSLDETPQLLNILIGKMSFIGPRPLIDAHEDRITIKIRKQNGAIKLKPGISGYAQIHGRTSISPEEKGNLDGVYFNKCSLILDTKIFVLTILKLFGSGKGR